MSYPKISVLIFTLNEELHLPLCLSTLDWCVDVIVIDSFSTDRTKEICLENGVRLFEHAFEGFGSQRNWALDNIDIKNPWVLVLDADERVPGSLVDEMSSIAKEGFQGIGAYKIKRRFHMWGRWLRYSSLYPTWVVRFIHKNKVRYVNRGHAETQEVKGRIGTLENDLIDENLKGIDEWFERQNRYSSKDAEYEIELEKGSIQFLDLFSSDPLVRRAALKGMALRVPARPLIYFIYSYFIRLGFLDGKDGLVFCLMKSLYQRMVEVKKYNARRIKRLK